MRVFSLLLFLLGTSLAALCALPANAQAGFALSHKLFDSPIAASDLQHVQFKISKSKARRRLEQRGFTDVVIIERGMTKVIAQACRDGERYQLVMNRSLEIRNSNSIGTCGRQNARMKPQDVVDILKDSHYTKITITGERPPFYTAEACKGSFRYSLKVGPKGRIANRDRIGPCRQAARKFGPGLRRIRDALRDEGYDRIVFFDRDPPVYGAEACSRGTLFELTVNARGRITHRDRLGRCEEERGRGRAHSPRQVEESLRAQGFEDIRLIDSQLPTYVAEACKDGRRFRLRLDRFAAISHGDLIGRCEYDRNGRAMSRDDIRDDLRARGYNRIRFTDTSPPNYAVEACRANTRLRLSLNRYGEIQNKRSIGACDYDDNDRGYVGGDIKEILESRRYYDVRLQEQPIYSAEVCRNARKFRLKVDRFGNEIQRKRIGWCRPTPGPSRFAKRFTRQSWISEQELMSREALRPSACQDYMEWLLARDTITFETGSAAIDPQSERLLRRLAHVANRCPNAQIEIAGHTDSDGSPTDNQRLSERRARAVVAYLRDHNVDTRRLTAVGYGESQPVAPNDTPWNKALNRRIEFVVSWADG